MAEQGSPGQRVKGAAEKRQQNQQGEDPAQVDARRADARDQLAKADSAADKLQQAQDVDDDLAGEAALNPYPAYEDKSIAELKGVAEGRKVQIGRDVEKSELVRLIRAKDPSKSAALDFMPLEDLRSLAGELDAELDDEFVRAHLVTELRAADTGAL